MALRPCRECGKEASTEAVSCPGCGTPDPTGERRRAANEASAAASAAAAETAKNTKHGCLGCLGLLVFFVFLAYAADDSDTDSAVGSQFTTQIEVVSACQGSVKLQLKAPATARFAFADARSVSIAGESARYASYVDAQNSFGAMVRSDFTCAARRESGGWSAIAALVEEPATNPAPAAPLPLGPARAEAALEEGARKLALAARQDSLRSAPFIGNPYTKSFFANTDPPCIQVENLRTDSGAVLFGTQQAAEAAGFVFWGPCPESAP